MSLALGYRHPDYLLDELTAEQLNDWEAFNRIHPIGTKRFDFYFSSLMATMHNIAIAFSGSKDAKQCKIEDFMPNWMGIKEEPDDMPVNIMKDLLKTFAAEQNKRVQEQQKKDSKPPKSKQ